MYSEHVGHVSTLGLDNDRLAKEYMRCILIRIEPLMKRRNWYIGALQEFYPRSKTLLGLNVSQGAEVLIRFRSEDDRSTFLAFEEVMCTTLHELAHNQYQRHIKPFWSLYYKLVEECEREEEFLLQQNKLVYPLSLDSSNPPLNPSSIAQEQSRQSQLLLRRLTQQVGGESTDHVDGERLSEEGNSNLMGSDGWVCDRCTFRNHHSVTQCEVCSEDETTRLVLNSLESTQRPKPWCCGKCTFYNEENVNACLICGNEKYTTLSSDND